MVEASEVLAVVNIAKLVAYKASVSNDRYLVGVRVTKYPRINATICNKVAQISCKCTIEQAAFVLGRNNCKRWQMVCYDNNMLGGALGNTLLYKR